MLFGIREVLALATLLADGAALQMRAGADTDSALSATATVTGSGATTTMTDLMSATLLQVQNLPVVLSSLTTGQRMCLGAGTLLLSMLVGLVLRSRPAKDPKGGEGSSTKPRSPAWVMLWVAFPVVFLWVLTAVLAVLAAKGFTAACITLGLPLFWEFLHRTIHAVRCYRGKFTGADLAFNTHAKAVYDLPTVPENAARVIMTAGTSTLEFNTETEADAFCETWSSNAKNNCRTGGDFTLYVDDDHSVNSKDVEQCIRDTLIEETPLAWADMVMTAKAHILRYHKSGKEVSVQCMVRHDVVDGFATLRLFAECMGITKPDFDMPKDTARLVMLLETNPPIYYLVPIVLAQLLSPKPLPLINSPPHLMGSLTKASLQPLVQKLDCAPVLVLQATMTHIIAKMLDRDIRVGFICRVTGLLSNVRNSLCGVSVVVPKGSSVEEIVQVFVSMKSSPMALFEMAASSFMVNRFHVAHAMGLKTPQGSDNIDLNLSHCILSREDIPVIQAYKSFSQDQALRRPARLITQLVGSRFLVDCAYNPAQLPAEQFRAALAESLPEFLEKS